MKFSKHTKNITKEFVKLADIIDDQAYNSTFHNKLESIQYNKCLAIAGAIRGTSIEKIYREIGLESFKSRRWLRKLCHFYKMFNEKFPSYLFNLIPNFKRVHNSRLSYNIPLIKVRHDYFKAHFFFLLYQSGISLTSSLETQQASILLKRSIPKPHTALCQ